MLEGRPEQNDFGSESMLHLFEATVYAFSSAWPSDKKLFAVYIHGNIDGAEEMLRAGAELYGQGKVNQVVINGLSQEESRKQKINYAGWEEWTESLIALGVPEGSVVRAAPATQTMEEAISVAELMKEKQEHSIAMITLPYHVLRCGLSHAAASQKAHYPYSVFPLPLRNLSWDEAITKQILGSEVIKRTRSEMLREEWDRICRYQQKGDCASFSSFVERCIKGL